MTNNTTAEITFNNNNTLEHGDCIVLHMKGFLPWNNPENIISAQTRDLVRKLKDVVFLPIAFLIGVPANVINMAVFYKHGLKERINVCLFALSLADGLYLVFNIIVHGEQIYLHFSPDRLLAPVLQWMFNHHIVGFYGVSWVSLVLSAIVASERCFCILQPLKSQTIFHASTTSKIIVAVSIVVMAGRFIVVSRFHVVCAYDPIQDTVIITAIGGEFYHKHQKLVDFLDVFLYGVGLPWVVIVVVVVTTIVTVIKLRQAAKCRADMSSNSDSMWARDAALTRMLVGNSIFFIVCCFPPGLFRLFTLLVPKLNSGKQHHNLYIALTLILNVISYINSTFNFVIYYTMGSRYRHTVRTLLGRKCTKVKSKTSTTTLKTL